MVQGVFGGHELPAQFSRNVFNLEYGVRGFSDLLALRACLTQAGVEVEWSDCLGYSGDAFSCDAMSYFSVRGHDALTAAARSYGFEGRWRFGAEQAHEDLRAALAEMRPCITPGFYGGCLWWVVILRERAQQPQFLVAGAGVDPQWAALPRGDGARPAWVGQCPWAEGAHTHPEGAPENWQPCPRFLLGDRKSLPAASVRLRRALQIAITSHRREEFSCHFGGGEKQTEPIGRGYLKQWPRLLREWAGLRGWSETGPREPLDDGDPDPPPSYRDAYFAPVAHGMRRRAAAAFLRAHLGEVGDGVRPLLESAAGHYEKSAAASGRIFTALCAAECLQGLDWYRRLQVGPSYVGERDEAGVAAAATFAKQHPDRWAARQAILRHMHESLQDATRVREACQAAGVALREDDAAIARIEAALTSLDGATT